jgi:hypothetical protein
MDVQQNSVTQLVSLVPGQNAKQAQHQSCGAERAALFDCCGLVPVPEPFWLEMDMTNTLGSG